MRLLDLSDPVVFKIAALTSSAVSGVTSVATFDLTMGILGVPLSVFLAGFAGALVSLSFLPPPVSDEDRSKTVLGMAGHVLSGTFLSAFTQPLAIFAINHYLKPDVAPPAISLGIAGILGALLMALLPIGIKYLKNKFAGETA